MDTGMVKAKLSEFTPIIWTQLDFVKLFKDQQIQF